MAEETTAAEVTEAAEVSEKTYSDEIKKLGDGIVELTLLQAKELADYLKPPICYGHFGATTLKFDNPVQLRNQC